MPIDDASAPKQHPRVRVLVAVDSPGESADAPIDAATALANVHGAKVRVMSVVNPYAPAWSVMGTPDAVTGAMALRGEQRQRRIALRGYLSQRAGSRNWALRVPLGTPGEVIVGEARRGAADLIVVGLRRHNFIGRIVRDATAMHVIRESPVPVLAATSNLHGMPSTVVVAVDFGHASVVAAQAACAIFSGCAKLILVYVQSEFDAALARGDETERVILGEGVAAAFERLISSIRVPRGTAVETVKLRGAVPEQLVGFAGRCGADVLAAARKRHDLTERLLAGSVTAALVHRAPCSLLITPPDAAIDASRWAQPSA